MRGLLILVTSISVGACQRADENKQPDQFSTPSAESGSGGVTAPRPKTEQVKPPLDLKAPPGDAVKTASGLIFKKLVTNEAGTQAGRNDTVLINYSGWRQATGETFFTNRSRNVPMPLNLATTAPGFTEALQLMKKGEKAVLWVPPSIGYRGTPPPGTNAETLVYEVEIVDLIAAPTTPADLKAAPAAALASKSGIKYVVVRPGTGKDKVRSFDTVTFNYSAWDAEGRMFDSTEIRKRPVTAPPFRQAPPLEEVLTTMTGGQRTRFWVDADKMATPGRPLPTQPKGQVVYEVELLQIAKGSEPPPVPPDVAKPPADARKTPKGVAFRMLKTGKGGPKPKVTDIVKIHYTGWTTDGRMFESTAIKNEPRDLNIAGDIVGWTEALPQLSVGDKARFWVPDELAYKGAPNKPQGMLVFDVELLEIKDPKAEHDADDGHGHGGSHAKKDLPAPPDVAAPPKDVKKSPGGVSYKVLKAGPGGPKPKQTDIVKVHYSGWTTDGKMFDSSVTRNAPAEFPLTGVIKGWTDAIPVMSVGDKVRFWIPEEMAYKGSPGKPQGMLVFDVELLEIKPAM